MSPPSSTPVVPGFPWTRLATVSAADPLRVIFSACILGHATGWDGVAYPEPLALRLAHLDNVKTAFFCPENAVLGTPRPLTTLYDGDGRAARAGKARVLETTGRDVTAELIRGADAMLAVARKHEAELAVMLEISDSCGSHAVYRGAPEDRVYQQGVGVAAATLADAGFPVMAQRDYASLSRLLGALDPSFVAADDAKDFVDQGFFADYFADGPVGIPYAEYERRKAERGGERG